MTTTLSDRLQQCAQLVGGIGKLATATEIPRSTLDTYLAGQNSPKPDRLAQICDATGVNGHWLLTGMGEIVLPKNRATSTPLADNCAPLARALFIVEDALSAVGRQIPTSSKVAITMTALAMLNGGISLDSVADSVRQLIAAMEDGKFSSDEIALVDTLRAATPAKRQMMLAHIRQGGRAFESTVTGL